MALPAPLDGTRAKPIQLRFSVPTQDRPVNQRSLVSIHEITETVLSAFESFGHQFGIGPGGALGCHLFYARLLARLQRRFQDAKGLTGAAT